MDIKFINPFGTADFDTIIIDTLKAYARPDTNLVVEHMTDAPRNIDYYWPKHLMETKVIESVVKSEKEGFDAVIVGCCYDPGVRVARELVDIPVIGPLEASLQTASYFGHSTTVVTDHKKALPYMQDLVKVYGYESLCKNVECINWYIDDMIQSPLATAADAFEIGKKHMEANNTESVILGCTIISACLEYAILDGKKEYLEFPILNPNTMALKMAESMGHLKQLGRYQINRSGYYGSLEKHNPTEFNELVDKYLTIQTIK